MLGTVAVALACALGGPALAQEPPIYEIPLPTPTPTGTPFQDPTPTPTATPAPTVPAGPARLSPFPYVRTAGSYSGDWTEFTRVVVRAPKGARLDARCNRGRCARVRRAVKTSKAARLKALERRFAPRTTIEIRISSPTRVGKYVRIRTLRGAPPERRDRCLRPGGSRPVPCEGL